MLPGLGTGPSSPRSSPFCCAAPVTEDTKKKDRKHKLQLTPSLRKQQQQDKKMTLNQILIKAGKRGLGGGLPGAIAGVVQVMTLMWLRTIINYINVATAPPFVKPSLLSFTMAAFLAFTMVSALR